MLGTYDINGYSRGRILWKGLKANEVDVDLFLKTGKGKYFALAKRLLKRDFDAVLVNGRPVLFTAWLLKWWHRKPILFDVFISDYDTLVFDRNGDIWFTVQGGNFIGKLTVATGAFRRLTRHHGIDTDPSWSPNGRQLVFVSDRAGSPHVFVMDS